MPRIRVSLASGIYDITVGYGLSDKLALYLRQQLQGQRLFVIYDANFYALHGKRLSELFRAIPGTVEVVVPSGEKSKSLAELTRLYEFLLEQQIARSEFMLAVGGGVTSDLVGFAAATTLRGIRWGVVSTTLLGMVDASIGGKTGINHVLGKNLIGAFWQPSFVWCDCQYLHTLPTRELISGFGELLKYAGLVGKTMTEPLADYLNNGLYIEDRKILDLIVIAAKYKAEIVQADERESYRRMVLNLGHTFGHAIEKVSGYGRLRHGEAVMLGLLAATELSMLENPRRTRALIEYRELVKRGVDLVPKQKLSADAIIKAMLLDKKRIGHKSHFILLDRPGKPIIVETPATAHVRKSITAMLDYYLRHGGRNA